MLKTAKHAEQYKQNYLYNIHLLASKYQQHFSIKAL